QMREEADDRGALLELGTELRNQRERLGIRIVEVEDDQRRALLLRIGQPSQHFLIRLDESHLDAQLAGSLLNFRQEEKVFNEAVDTCGRVFANGNDRLGRSEQLVGIPIAVSVALTIAVGVYIAIAEFDGGRRRIGDVAIRDAVAVIHGTDKNLLLALLALPPAAAALLASGVSIFLKEAVLAGGFGLLSLTRLVLRGRLAIRLASGLVALSSATPSAVSLILSLWPLPVRRLGLRLR